MDFFSNLFNKTIIKSINCPYCGYKFEEIPMRKRKCPECNNTIYVQKNEKEVNLLTEHQHKELEIMTSLSNMGMPQKDFIAYKKDYYQKFGDKAKYDDFLWSIYHSELNRHAKNSAFYPMKALYYLLAEVVKDKPAERLKLQKLGMRMELLNFQSTGLTLDIQIIADTTSC